jgi:hypothetical protein
MSIGLITPLSLRQYSFWEVLLTSGKVIRETQTVKDAMGERLVDWTLDLNSSGDLRRIKEVRLICPGLMVHGVLKIKESQTAFQFKNSSAVHDGQRQYRVLEAQVVGRVTDKVTGACDCFIWDRLLGLFKYSSNIRSFGTWHDRIAPISVLSQNVLGLNL